MHVTPRMLLHIGRLLSSWLSVSVVGVCAAFAGSHLQANLEALDAGRGDRFDGPRAANMQVLVVTTGGELQRVALGELRAFAARHSDLSLTLPAPGSVRIELDTPRRSARMDYRIVGREGSGQLIETVYRDNEWHIVSRYVAGDARITPLYARAWNPWLIGTALVPYGLPSAGAVWLLGYWLRRREERVLLELGERPYLRHRYRLS